MMKGDESLELPAPDGAARAHSDRLCGMIRAEIGQAGGCIPFARYMELALYAPGLGYYSAGRQKFGADGDFMTAPEISPLFSRCLARQCAQVLDLLDGGGILEFGAGSGAMAGEILAWLEGEGALPERYWILEPSADLRQRQQARLRERLPHLAERIAWLDHLPEAGFRGVALANEVLDAMPVHRLVKTESGLRELHVVCGEDGGFDYRLDAVSHPALEASLAAALPEGGSTDDFPAGYIFDVNLAAPGWVGSVGGVMEKGAVFIIDYGEPRHEYYHPRRTDGTLKCFYRHRIHGNPLILAGLQDITAHVDFTAIAAAAHENGLSIAGYTTQAGFLEACGIADMMPCGEDDPLRMMELARQVRKLMLPGEMGEVFKVMGLARGLETALLGFTGRDETCRL